ncbi:Lipid A export ATP-binding/permease protein MsbA [Tritrichomonas foetus]|uniref:Lipid A export ATP-binding/permease protein MsbA n=1 Tax=Tritrichomonas foetus TaxID=1144522 RepID=A0A1J4K423_9EUKA|nr:Lipid A export ATP-binding/permease protein MsbA [Tritrichomonas foetus]|eukprot:OHT05939.1 Lipid A export ATP-binding/permease protein MsbA [Tritrichomonas foetus]
MDGQDFTVFRQNGSDDSDVIIKGNEFARIFKFYKKKFVFILCVLLSVISGMLPLFMTVLLGNSLDTILNKQNNFVEEFGKYLVKFAGVLIGIIVTMGLTFGLRGYADNDFVEDLRNSLFEHLVRQDIEFFDETSTGVLMSRLSEDISLVLNVYVDKMINTIQYVVQMVAAFILCFTADWRISLMCMCLIPIALAILLIGEHYITKEWHHFKDNSTKLNCKTDEILTSFRTVKSFNNELFELSKYEKNLYSVHRVVVKASRIHAIKNSLLYFFSLAVISPLLYYAGYIILKKPEYGLKPGDTLILFMVFGMLGLSMCQIVSISDDFRKAKIASAKILQIIYNKPTIENQKNQRKGKKICNVRGLIEFKNVSFRYKSHQNEYAVKNLSFTVNPGETVAFVGESGCGKTTTIQLLQRFYDIDSGEILIDGVDIRTMSPESLRSHISVVAQIPTVFSMSVADNIGFAKPDSSRDRIRNAASIGNSHDFIMELDENYQTIIKQFSLSGGQKQRICISRAIMKNSPILLLDEATAALDSESERYVQESIEHCREGKTTIIVAHRLSTVINADRIMVFKNGQIIEEGSHEQLLEKQGYYYELIHFQLQ